MSKTTQARYEAALDGRLVDAIERVALKALGTEPRWRRLDRLLEDAERHVALISRCQPKNAASEKSRLFAAWSKGMPELPRWTYAPVPDLTVVRERLAAATEPLQMAQPIDALYFERSEELALETKLVEAIATNQMVHLARARFQCDERWAGEAEALALRWAAQKVPAVEAWHRSDDPGDEHSLLRQVQGLVGRERLPFRVELTGQLSADAATGSRVIFVAKGRLLTQAVGRRIALHEVYGHALPRHRAARQRLGLFSVASARGNDDQEGFALYQEEVWGLLDDRRKRELGARHLAATLVLRGASYPDVVSALLTLDLELALALKIAGRVCRGGGLAREFSYLPAYCRVRASACQQPHLVNWLHLGRVSLDAARVLASLSRELL